MATSELDFSKEEKQKSEAAHCSDNMARLSANAWNELPADSDRKLPHSNDALPNLRILAVGDKGGRATPVDNAGAPQRDLPKLNEHEQRLVDSIRDRGANEAVLHHLSEDLAKLRMRNDLPPKEIKETLNQVEKLFNKRGEHPVTENERLRIGLQIIYHAANPTKIDQGHHNTCNVATIEERLFTRCPSKAAEMIVTAATTGRWTAPDGKVIRLDTGGHISFSPGLEERAIYPRDGSRSHASQIFQVVAVNDATQRREPARFYRQDMTEANPKQTGEHVYFADNEHVMSKDKDGKLVPVTSPNLSNKEIADICHRITGERGYFLQHSSWSAGEGLTQISSKEQLIAEVEKLQKQGQLPATVAVDANYPGIIGSGNPKDYGSWHAFSIIGYDAQTGRFQVSNQWGSAHDREINANDVFKSMGGWPLE